jgi:Flp pilus assembly protein TadG
MRKSPILRGGRRRRSGGAAIIEMVISLLVLFYLVMGGVEFGWYLFSKHIVQSAARDGARAGIIGTATHAQVAAAVNDTMTSAGFSSGYTTSYQRVVTSSTGTLTYSTITDASTVSRGEGLRVTVSAPFSAFRVRPLGVIPATKTLTGVTTMIKE